MAFALADARSRCVASDTSTQATRQQNTRAWSRNQALVPFAIVSLGLAGWPSDQAPY